MTKALRFNLGVLTVVAISALLAACGGSQPPIGAPGAVPLAPITTAATAHGTSRFRSNASSKLLYVGDGQTVRVYSFPQGELVGTLGGFQRTEGLCTDKAAHVFITDEFAGTITEYAHAGTNPIRTLYDPGRTPNDCSVDPGSGDLAVANIGDYTTTGVAIYKNARGQPTFIKDPSIYTFYYCSYDNNGNLFVDGSNYPHTDAGQLDELAKGSSKLETISVDQGFSPGGGVQWDGSYLALESPRGEHNTRGPTVIDRLQISGTTGTMTKPVYLSAKGDQNPGVGTQFWIDGANIINREYRSRGVGLWNYPAGGKVRSTFKAHAALGLTISTSS